MAAIDTSAAAFVAGMVTSMHCVAMCGPLSCSWAVRPGEGFVRNTALYHVGRISSYALLGALAGTLGVLPLTWFQNGAALVLPWTLVVVFALVGVGLDRILPKPKILARPVQRLQKTALAMKPAARATLLGVGTPLLPCGPLYIMLGLALAQGSAMQGAEFAAAFALGTLPLLWLAQGQLHWLGGRLTPIALARLQRGLALTAAVVLAWRLRGTFYGETAEQVLCH